MDIVYQGLTLHPDLLPDTADPKGSTRYCNVTIIHNKIESNICSTSFDNHITDNYSFIVNDKSPEYKGYECNVFKGTVLKEADGTYSWWRSIN